MTEFNLMQYINIFITARQLDKVNPLLINFEQCDRHFPLYDNDYAYIIIVVID